MDLKSPSDVIMNVHRKSLTKLSTVQQKKLVNQSDGKMPPKHAARNSFSHQLLHSPGKVICNSFALLANNDKTSVHNNIDFYFINVWGRQCSVLGDTQVVSLDFIDIGIRIWM